MPYVIKVPGNPRPFITNNPIIYMDCRTWGWGPDSRRYGDHFCKRVRDEEAMRFETDHREKELDRIWSEEVNRREALKNSMSVPTVTSAPDVTAAPTMTDAATEMKSKLGQITIIVKPVSSEHEDQEDNNSPVRHGVPMEMSRNVRV